MFTSNFECNPALMDTTRAARHEVPLAASYYVLFSNLQQKEQSLPLEGEAQSAGAFWEEDFWSQEELTAAEQRLAESRERCHIRNNAVVSSNANDDEQAWNKFYSQHQTNFFKVQ